MKKFFCILLTLSLSMTAFAALAEGTVDVILGTGATQAFTDEAVSEEDLNLILQAGLKATSAINQQPWFFAVVTNQDVMAQLSGGMGGFPGAAPGGEGTPPEGFTPPEGGAAPGGMPEGAPAAPMATDGAKAAMGDSPVAIIIYMNEATASPNASYDCGLATQNMVIAASALGYGTKIVSSPTMTLNGDKHDELCELLGVDKALSAVAVLLVGRADLDATSSASVRSDMADKVSFVK